MNLLIGAATIGLILALLGLGVFLSYRVYHLVDLTADGSFGLGVAVVGRAAGRRHVAPRRHVVGRARGRRGRRHHRRAAYPVPGDALLAGVLTSTALYSVSLFVMGGGNVNLASSDTLVTVAERAGAGSGCRPRSR